MLRRDVTWGQLRAIRATAVATGQEMPNDMLADPKVFAASRDKADSDYVYDISPADIAEFERLDASMDEARYFFTEDDEGGFHALIKEEDEMYYLRENQVWRPVSVTDEEPTLDDLSQVETRQGAVALWDELGHRPVKTEADLITFL